MYFPHWDKIFGTLHPEYEKIFDIVVNEKQREVGELSKLAF